MMQCPKCGAMTFTGKYCFSCQYTDKEKVQAGIKNAAVARQTAKPASKEERVQSISNENLDRQQIDYNSQTKENKANTGSLQAKTASPMSFDQLRSASSSQENQKVIKPPTKEELDKIKGTIKEGSPAAKTSERDVFSSDELGIADPENGTNSNGQYFAETGEEQKDTSEWSKPVISWSDPAEFNETWKEAQSKPELQSATTGNESSESVTSGDGYSGQSNAESQFGPDDNYPFNEFQDPLLDSDSGDAIAFEETLNNSVNRETPANIRAVDALKKDDDAASHSLLRDYSKQEQDGDFDKYTRCQTAGDSFSAEGKRPSILESAPALDEKPAPDTSDESEMQRLNTRKGSAQSPENKTPGRKTGFLGKFGKGKEVHKEEPFDPATLSEDELFDKLSEDVTEKEGQGKKKERDDAKISEDEQYEMDRADFLDPDESVYNPNYDNYYDDVQADALSYPDKITAGDVLKIVGIVAAIILFLVMMMFVI